MTHYILQEDGTSKFILEDSSGFLILDDSIEKVINETINILEFVPSLRTRLKSISESIHITESVNKIRTRLRAVNESIHIVELIARSSDRLRLVNEIINIIESGNNARLLQEDGVSKFVLENGSGFLILESTTSDVVWIRTRLKSVNEIIHIPELILKSATIIRVIRETVKVVENVFRPLHLLFQERKVKSPIKEVKTISNSNEQSVKLKSNENKMISEGEK